MVRRVQFGTGSEDRPAGIESSAINGAVTPKVSRGGADIQAALDDGDPIILKRGEYVVESPLEMGDDELRGLGRRGKSILRAGAAFPAGEPLIKTAAGSNTPVISGVDIDCRGNAQDGVVFGTDSRDGNLSYCRIRHAQRDAIRIIEGYNHLITRVRCRRNNRSSIVLGDSGGPRMSSVKIDKCHLDKHGEAENSYSSQSWPTTMGVMHGAGENDNATIPYYDEATKASPGVLLESCDISGADIGYYMGRRAAGARFVSADFENNTTGIQIGHPDMQSFVPSNFDFYGGQFSNNATAISIETGRSVYIQGADENGSTTGLNIASAVNPDDIQLGANNTLDSGIVAPNGYRSTAGVEGTRMAINSAQMRPQDLTAATSNGSNDYRHHDGSGTPAAGLYRGDGAGGWVRVEDNSVTI